LQRLQRLLTWKRARIYALVLAFIYVFAWILVLVHGAAPLGSSNEPIGGDYVAFYAAGRLLLSGDGSHIYDRAAVSAIQDGALQGRLPGFYDAFRNPPFLAIVFAPLAGLDLLPSLAAWSVLSLLAFALALWLVCDVVPEMRGRWRGLMLVAFAFAPIYFGLIDGQNSTASLLLYVLIYRSLLRREDRAAGLWAALGLFKPQLFFVFPLIFLATRRWQALATYAGTAAVLAVVSFAAVGIEGIQGWLRILVDIESDNALRNAWRMHTLKTFFDLLLPAQSGWALGLYVASALALLAALLRAWSRQAAPLPLLWVATSLVAVLVDPHLVDYDLSVLIPAGVLAAIHLPRLRWAIVLLYPMLVLRAQVPLGDSALQLTVPVLMASTAYSWLQFPGPSTSFRAANSTPAFLSLAPGGEVAAEVGLQGR
jgi:alpha-1,2-mannosyltransferase